MITFTDEYVALVVAKDEPPAERLRVLLILAQQVVTSSGSETSAVRDLFGLIRALVDQLAHQAAGGEQPAKGLR